MQITVDYDLNDYIWLDWDFMMQWCDLVWLPKNPRINFVISSCSTQWFIRATFLMAYCILGNFFWLHCAPILYAMLLIWFSWLATTALFECLSVLTLYYYDLLTILKDQIADWVPHFLPKKLSMTIQLSWICGRHVVWHTRCLQFLAETPNVTAPVWFVGSSRVSDPDGRVSMTRELPRAARRIPT